MGVIWQEGFENFFKKICSLGRFVVSVYESLQVTRQVIDRARKKCIIEPLSGVLASVLSGVSEVSGWTEIREEVRLLQC